MNIHKILNVVIKPFRKRRMNKFMEIISPSLSSSIIDVGGTIYNWELIRYEGKVIILNLTIPKNLTDVPQNYLFVEGDGTKLTYSDCEFDILFSNSVIEHLGTYDRQKKFAHEARRVGTGFRSAEGNALCYSH